MTRISGTLTTVTSTHTHVRTASVVGTFEKFPTVGSAFAIVGDSLTHGPEMRRMVYTSRIREVTETKPGNIVFKTANSTYRLEFEVQ